MITPSADAKRAAIGTNFHVSRFERRGRNGEYAALRPRLDNHDLAFQAALLNGKRPHWSDNEVVFVCTVVALGLLGLLVSCGRA